MSGNADENRARLRAGPTLDPAKLWPDLDELLARRQLVRSCGHHWAWASRHGVFAWSKGKPLRDLHGGGGRCDVSTADGKRCSCISDHVLYAKTFGRGTPRAVVDAIFRRAARSEELPAEFLKAAWITFVRAEWLYGSRDTWNLIIGDTPTDRELLAKAVRWHTEKYGTARPILSLEAGVEARRLRRAEP